MIIFALKEIFIISWRHFNCCTCLMLRITSLCCNALPHTHKHIHTPCFNCFQLNAFSFAFFTQYKLHLLLYNFTAHTHTRTHTYMRRQLFACCNTYACVCMAVCRCCAQKMHFVLQLQCSCCCCIQFCCWPSNYYYIFITMLFFRLNNAFASVCLCVCVYVHVIVCCNENEMSKEIALCKHANGSVVQAPPRRGEIIATVVGVQQGCHNFFRVCM